jgi:putative hemolysin
VRLTARACDVLGMLLELGMILLLVMVNGLFAGAEIAIVGLDRLRLRHLVEQGRSGARVVEALRAQPERFLATVQIAITVAGAAAAAFGGATFAEDLEPMLVPYVGHHAQLVSVVLVVGLVSYLSLIFGELVPKSLALRHSERYALLIGPVLNGLALVARPLVWFLTKSSNLVLGPVGDHTTFTESRLSPAELRELLHQATESGSLDERGGELANRALTFARLTVAQVMVPRTRVVGIRAEHTQEELRELVLESPHSRLPVYGRSLDDISGYVLHKDLLSLAWQGNLIVFADLVRPPHFVGKGMLATELLEEMRQRRQQLSIVLDDHGGTAGIVTLDDLTEELTGEVLNELQTPKPLSIHPQADGSMLVQGDVPLHEVNRDLRLELSGGGRTTLGGLCIFLAQGLPQEGQELEASDGTRLRVERATPRSVELVRVLPKSP